MEREKLKGWRGTIHSVDEAHRLIWEEPVRDEFGEPLHYGIQGVWEISNANYHAGPGISNSGLALIERAPILYRDREKYRKETQSKDIGKALHTLVLEPEKAKTEIAIMPEMDRRTKQGKADYEAFCAANSGKTILKWADGDTVLGMASNVLSHRTASTLLTGGCAELSFYWNAPTGLVRCRTDYLQRTASGGLAIVDLKTTRSAHPDEFKWSVRDYRYHVQAAFYSDIVHHVTGIPVESFTFVAVESTEPYLVGVYTLHPDLVAEGRLNYKKNLATYAECKASNRWPGYPETIQNLKL